VSARPDWQFDPALGERKLLEQLKAASLASWQAQDLPQAHAAASALLNYCEHTQGRALTHLHSVRVQRNDELIDLPQTTRRNLELTQTLRGEEKPTLFSLLDTCMTGMGSRLLKSWLLAPRRERSEAQQRHSAIAALHSATTHGEPAWRRLREQLKGSTDVERITARMALRQVRPRELVALTQTLQKSELLAHIPQALEPYLTHISEQLQPPRWLR
jgi:DNA mismatch repair protein MutS